MAVTFDVVSESIRTVTTDPWTWTHTTTAAPEAVVVACINYSTATDQITSITYGGVALSEVVQAADTANETTNVQLWFRGNGLPSGNQTVSVDLASSTGDDFVFYCLTFNAAGNCLVVDSDSLSNDQTDTAQVTLQYGGKSAMAVCAFAGGLSSVGDYTLTGSCTAVGDNDSGQEIQRVDRQTTAGTSDFTIGYTFTGSTDDVALAALAITDDLSQAVTTAYEDNTETVRVPTVTPPPQSVGGDTIASGAVVRVATLALAITTATIASGAQVFEPTAAYQVDGATYTNTATVSAPEEVEAIGAAQDVTGDYLGSGALLYEPSVVYVVEGVTVGSGSSVAEPTLAYQIDVPALPTGAVVGEPSITVGPVAVTGDTIGSGSTLYEPTVAVGAVAVETAYQESTLVLGPPDEVVPGAVAVEGATITSGSSVAEPTLAAVVEIPTIATGSAATEPSVTVGAVEVEGATIAAGSTVAAPEEVAGGNAVFTAFLDSGALLGEPTVIPGAVEVEGATIGSGSSVAAPGEIVQPQTITLPALGTVAETFAPTLTVGAVSVEGATLAGGAALWAPTVIPAALPVALPTLSSGASLGAPSVVPSAQTVEVPKLTGVVVVWEPIVSYADYEIAATGGFVFGQAAARLAVGEMRWAVPLSTVTVQLDDNCTAIRGFCEITWDTASQQVVLPHIGSTVVVRPPIPVGGDNEQAVTLPTVSGVGTPHAPSVQLVTGEQPVAGAAIGVGSVTFAPTVTPFSQAGTAASAPSTAVVRAPSVLLLLQLVETPEAIASTEVCYEPEVEVVDLSQPVGGMPRISAGSVPHAPTVTSQFAPQDVLVPRVVSTATVSSPDASYNVDTVGPAYTATPRLYPPRIKARRGGSR